VQVRSKTRAGTQQDTCRYAARHVEVCSKTRGGTQQDTWRYAANIRNYSGIKVATDTERGVSGETVQNQQA
jgi:hypothetical protein